MSLRAKDHLEGTKVAAFPRYCAPQKVQTGSAAAGGHRGVATRKATGDPATHGGAGDPAQEKRAVCGYVRPWPRRRRGTQALCNSTFTQPVTGGGC